MSGHAIKEVIVGIAGGHIKGMNGHGMVTLREKEVTHKDIERVIESANALLIPAEREIIHAIAQDYTVDRESGIKDPVGIHGLKLEADVHIVTGDVTAARNIIKCIGMSGMTSVDMVLEQIASSEAVLTQDEKEIGGSDDRFWRRHLRHSGVYERKREVYRKHHPWRRPSRQGYRVRALGTAPGGKKAQGEPRRGHGKAK